MRLTTTVSVDVPVPAEAAYDFVSDSSNYPAIYPTKGRQTGVVRAFFPEGGGSRPGARRRVVMSDGEEFDQEYVSVDRPNGFHYRIRRDAQGLEKLLVAGIDSRWTFEPAERGARVTWTSEHALTSVLGFPVMFLYTRLVLRPMNREFLGNVRSLLGG